MDTIYALASARGKAGVSVIRISGPLAFQVGFELAGSLPENRKFGLRVLRDASGDVLDQALVLVFPSGQSFTGEDVIEFHVHGSPAVISAVTRVLSQKPGLRMAEAGEFTRRALENECLDVVQIEGLGDLIEAETEAQRRQAQRVFSGHLGAKVQVWRDRLVRSAALIEASIDFADEDVPVDVVPEVRDLLSGLLVELKKEEAGVKAAEQVRDGFEVAIVGAPNVGKSTLLNYLAGRDAAITSEIAGTTRDIVEVRMDLNGYPVVFLDTAGIRESTDVIEKIGIDRTRHRASDADLRLFLVDGDLIDLGVAIEDEDIVVRCKSDLNEIGLNGLSGLTGKGVDEVVGRIIDVLDRRLVGIGSLTRDRHRVAVVRSIGGIRRSLDVLEMGEGHFDIAAEELRDAIRALDSLVGRVDVEEILGDIFSRFCIGK